MTFCFRWPTLLVPLYSIMVSAAPTMQSILPLLQPPWLWRWKALNLTTMSTANSVSPHMNTRSQGTNTLSKITVGQYLE